MEKVVFTTGGTGGHIYPALSIAKKVREQGIDTLFIGTKHRMEKDIIPNENLDLNNKTLDMITDYCEDNNLALFGWTGYNGIHGTISDERDYTSVVQFQLDDFKNFIQSKNIEIYCTKLIDLWYDEEFMDKWYDSSLEIKIALSETEE